MRASPHTRSSEVPATTRGPTPAWGWAALVLVLAVLVLGVLGGIVALAYSPLAAGLFGPGEPESPSPAGQIDNVPAPDNTIRQTEAQFEREARRRAGGPGDADQTEAGPQDGPPPPIEGLDTPAREPQ